jgi:hypothetical protein
MAVEIEISFRIGYIEKRDAVLGATGGKVFAVLMKIDTDWD